MSVIFSHNGNPLAFNGKALAMKAVSGTLFEQDGDESPNHAVITGSDRLLTQVFTGHEKTTGMPCDFCTGNTMDSCLQRIDYELFDETISSNVVQFTGSPYTNRVQFGLSNSITEVTMSAWVNVQDGTLTFVTDDDDVGVTVAITSDKVTLTTADRSDLYDIGAGWHNLKLVSVDGILSCYLYDKNGNAIIAANIGTEQPSLVGVQFENLTTGIYLHDFVVLDCADHLFHDKPYVNDDGSLNKF
ncbi:MAG: hypothetical protein MJZ25_03525 [Fibrobacter sp.]|nr:hypothetical protein [Fibrobacter sp.]